VIFYVKTTRRALIDRFWGIRYLTVHPVLVEKVEHLFEEGEIDLAKVWALVSCLGMISKQQLQLLIYGCMRESKNSRLFVTRWLLAIKRGWLNTYHKCRFINITYNNGDKYGLDDQSTSILMEPDTKLTTLLWLIKSKINVSLITDCEVHLNLHEYSYAIDVEFMDLSISDI
jgi:hypothetical protein